MSYVAFFNGEFDVIEIVPESSKSGQSCALSLEKNAVRVLSVPDGESRFSWCIPDGNSGTLVARPGDVVKLCRELVIEAEGLADKAGSRNEFACGDGVLKLVRAELVRKLFKLEGPGARRFTLQWDNGTKSHFAISYYRTVMTDRGYAFAGCDENIHAGRPLATDNIEVFEEAYNGGADVGMVTLTNIKNLMAGHYVAVTFRRKLGNSPAHEVQIVIPPGKTWPVVQHVELGGPSQEFLGIVMATYEPDQVNDIWPLSEEAH